MKTSDSRDTDRGASEARRGGASWLPWVICALGCAVSLGVWQAMVGQQEMAVEARFDRDAGEREFVIEELLNDALRGLHATAALFEAGREVDREQFHDMARRMLELHPQLVDVRQPQDLAVAAREAFEGSMQGGDSVLRVERLAHIEGVGRQDLLDRLVGDLGPAAAPPQLVLAGVGGDLSEPGAQARLLDGRKARHRAEGAKERVLSEVARCFIVANIAPADPPHEAVVTVEDLREGAIAGGRG